MRQGPSFAGDQVFRAGSTLVDQHHLVMLESHHFEATEPSLRVMVDRDNWPCRRHPADHF